MVDLKVITADEIEDYINRGIPVKKGMTDRHSLVVLYKFFNTFYDELSHLDRLNVLSAINNLNSMVDQLHEEKS